MKYAIRFSKGGLLRYLSYHETMTAIERLLRRSRIPMAYSQGFHPHVKISYSPAVLTGVASAGIYITLETTEEVENMVDALGSQNAHSLRVLSSWEIDERMKINDFLDSYLFTLILPADRFDPEKFDPELEVIKKTKGGANSFRAAEAFRISEIVTLRKHFMVKYTQSVEAMVPFSELLVMMKTVETASQEGVYVFVNDGVYGDYLTSDILDNVGGIRNVRS